LPTAGGFDETLAAEFSRSVLSGDPFSLLLVDIDHFKAINDIFGHQRGDDCLVEVGRALRSRANRRAIW